MIAKNKKSQTGVLIVLILLFVVVAILIYLLFSNQIMALRLTGFVVSEKASASLIKGVEYSSEFQSENKFNEKIWVISSAIFKVLIGFAVVLIAIAILVKVTKKKK